MADTATPIYADNAPPGDQSRQGYAPKPYRCDICGGWYDLNAVRHRAANFCVPCQDEAIARIKEPTEVELAVQAERRKAHFGVLRAKG